MKVLLDHHMRKQGVLLWSIMENEGWLKLMDIPMVTFADIGMPIDAPDHKIWHFAQQHQLILLTENRNNEGEDSLEQTIREENTPSSLPVLTIGLPDRMRENNYRKQCAERIVDIVLDIENYLGIGRIYIP